MNNLDEKYDLWPYDFYYPSVNHTEFVRRIIKKANLAGLKGIKVENVLISEDLDEGITHVNIEIDWKTEKRLGVRTGT